MGQVPTQAVHLIDFGRNISNTLTMTSSLIYLQTIGVSLTERLVKCNGFFNVTLRMFNPLRDNRSLVLSNGIYFLCDRKALKWPPFISTGSRALAYVVPATSVSINVYQYSPGLQFEKHFLNRYVLYNKKGARDRQRRPLV